MNLIRAWETAQTLPIAVYGSDPHLKLTGILITLTEVIELNGKPHEACEFMGNYLDNLAPLDEETTYNQWSGAERMRLAAMAHKLGLMAESYSRPQKEQEKWLTWAVERALKDIRHAHESSDRSPSGAGTTQPLHELELPGWVVRSDLLVFLKSLGEFHARTNQTRYIFLVGTDMDADGYMLASRLHSTIKCWPCFELISATEPSSRTCVAPLRYCPINPNCTADLLCPEKRKHHQKCCYEGQNPRPFRLSRSSDSFRTTQTLTRILLHARRRLGWQWRTSQRSTP